MTVFVNVTENQVHALAAGYISFSSPQPTNGRVPTENESLPARYPFFLGSDRPTRTMIVALLGLAAVLLAIEGARRLKQSRSPTHPGRPPLPPGPTPLPFLGNVLGMNKNAPHLTYTTWSKTYGTCFAHLNITLVISTLTCDCQTGDIVYTRVLGQDIIVLNSEQVAVALLEKRSQKYSDRPVFSAADLCVFRYFCALVRSRVNSFDFEWPSTSARYGPRFRLHRRLLHQVFHAKATLGYREKQLLRAYELLTRLLDDPARYAEHFTTCVQIFYSSHLRVEVLTLLHRFSASVVMEVTYGYDMKGGETFVTSMQRAADIFFTVTTPEIFALCTAFPFGELLPFDLMPLQFFFDMRTMQ